MAHADSDSAASSNGNRKWETMDCIRMPRNLKLLQVPWKRYLRVPATTQPLVYRRNRSVASTSAEVMPGSYAECPAFGMIFNSASGQALCSAQALSMGQGMS